MGQPISVTVSHRFAAPAEKIFDAWLEPAQVRKWLSMALKSLGQSGEIVRVEIDPKIGGKFLFSDMRDGSEYCHWGTYTKLDHPNRLAFTWNTVDSDESDPCNVVLSIEPDGNDNVLTLVNEMDEKWADEVGQTKKGWRTILQAEDDLLKKQSAHQ